MYNIQWRTVYVHPKKENLNSLQLSIDSEYKIVILLELYLLIDLQNKKRKERMVLDCLL